MIGPKSIVWETWIWISNRRNQDDISPRRTRGGEPREINMTKGNALASVPLLFLRRYQYIPPMPPPIPAAAAGASSF